MTFIEDLIQNAGPSYWLAGSATGELLFKNEWVVPRSSFVSVELALDTIQAFLEDGRRVGAHWIVMGLEGEASE